MHQIRYIMIGGFLGAGKTTTLARLARTYTAQGLNVGIVTNDQAADLVDTNMLRSLGFDVGEVAGACFCCSFDDLMSTVRSLGTGQRPDVILAEPVGSCTDLVATVIQPIRQLFDAEFKIAPYAVIVKPSHGQRILGQQSSGFSPKAAYIFTKQIEEADLVLINRIDELSDEQAASLTSLVGQHVPDTPVLQVSAKTGAGFDELTEWLGRDGEFGRRLLDIDYDTYADGEAELGWLNSSLRVTGDGSFDLDALLMDIVGSLKVRLENADVETAHLKAIGLWEGFFGVANLVSRESAAELSLPSGCQATSADVIINARVACDPAQLETDVLAVVDEAMRTIGASAENRSTQSFRPGRPVPTHRVTELAD